MPVCQSCEKEWTWLQSMKYQFSLKCPYCDKNQYITKNSKKKTMIFNFLPAIILLMIWLFNLSWPVIVALFVLVPVITFSIYPFMIKLTNEEEVLWR